MKIALLGGSFNPVHTGHLVLADSVCTELGYEQVVFVPAFCPPHKELSESVSASDRLAMVRAAIAGDDRFRADGIEIERGGVSYTYDTVCEFEKKFSDRLTGKVGVVLGHDLVSEYCYWYRAADLALKADLILAHRPDMMPVPSVFSNQPKGVYGAARNSESGEPAEFPYQHLDLSNPELAVSSSDIRMRIAQHGAWRYLVPDAVYHYIIARNLYGSQSD